jgi:tRNA modification GTPase
MLDDGQIIVACANHNDTNQAISLIRISGFKNFDFIQPFISFNFKKIQPRFVYVSFFKDNQSPIDQICLTYFMAPNSFTGENLLELSVHGNVLNVDRILNLLLSIPGVRFASAGEFTKRAYINKKLNLTQVEGLDLFLNANSNLALNQGLSLLNGELFKKYELLLSLFLQHKSALEVLTDFSDDVGDDEGWKIFHNSLKLFSDLVFKLDQDSFSGSSLLSPDIVLFGEPNSGKSTLFNLCLGSTRSIVSKFAGTTRDFISESIKINGTIFKIIDTAGIRHTIDEIESLGIGLSRNLLKNAFFKVLLINPLSSQESLSELVGQAPDIYLFTHIETDEALEMAHKISKKLPVGANCKYISLKSDVNLSSLIFQNVSHKFNDLTKDNPVLIARQRILISSCSKQTTNYLSHIQNEHYKDLGVLSLELENIGYCLSELVGIVSPDQVLDNIFANFCIGK